MILFTRPIPRPALWGGTLLREYFRYPDFPDGSGQSWSFSAQDGEGQSNVIVSGDFAGHTLRDLWRDEPQLFRSGLKRFPVIISLVAPEDDLSIQVHPNDACAARLGYPTGKNEAWYFLEAAPGAQIVYGQNAHNERELRDQIAAGAWDRLIRLLPVSRGDFVYLPAGMLHALKRGSIVYEIQQATDVTYRFYDYGRRDAQGRGRPLQVEQAIGCVDFSLAPDCAHPPRTTESLPHAEVTTLCMSAGFCVRRYVFSGAQGIVFPSYRLMTCVQGTGDADGEPLSIGRNFLITAGSIVHFDGNMTLLCTSET